MALLARLGLPRTHCVTVMTNRMKSISSRDLKTQLVNIRLGAVDILQSAACQDILARTRVVTETEDCQREVGRIMAAGGLVGVDFEGVAASKMTSLVQISDLQGRITMFRTGVNPDLFFRGGLADILQSQEIIKIIHGSSSDCLSLYKDNVKLWNIFDTAVAYKVLDFQKTGSNFLVAQTISFNNLCSHYSLPENPMKDLFKNILWKMEVTEGGLYGLDNPKPMLDELLVYCAWDVDPLISLYNILSTEISPCYQNFVSQMSEIEIIRAIDPSNAKIKRKNLKTMFFNVSLFLSNLPPGTTPADLYCTLAAQSPGLKDVNISEVSRTASVTLDSREVVVNTVKEYDKWAPRNMIEQGSQCKLFVEHFDNEVFVEPHTEGEEADTEEAVNVHSGMNKYALLLEVEMCRDIVRTILLAKAPVVVDFSLYSDQKIGVELYLGRMPAYKLVLSQRMLEEGELASLFSGDSVKIVNRMDGSTIHSALKYLVDNNVNLRNIYDLSLGVRSLDFFQYGQSWFQQPMPSAKSIGKYVGLTLPSTSRQHQCYLAYLQVSRKTPAKIQSLLETFVDLDIAISTDSKDGLRAKMKKSDLKRELENKSVHIRLIGKSVNKDSRDKMKDLVYSFNDVASGQTDHEERMGIVKDYHDFGRTALVQLSNITRVHEMIDYLESARDELDLNFRVTNTSYKSILEKPKTSTNMEILDNILSDNLAKLSNAGLQISY